MRYIAPRTGRGRKSARGFVSLFIVIWCAGSVIGQQRPNVILMMTDDQGYGDFGVHGNDVIRTPNLDAMAARSASMSNFYVSPVCSPTRASLMTGRYNFRTRCIDTWLGRSMMDPDEVTVAELLSAAGYETGIFGKWHLGDCYPMRAIDQGFKESLIHRGGGLAQPSEPRENRRRYTNPILFHNGEQVETKGFCTDVYMDAAIDFIRHNTVEKNPFFVYIATNAPHNPLHDVPEQLRKEYVANPEAMLSLVTDPADPAKSVDQLSRIAAMITNFDENVGRLFAALAELKITNDTLVIYLNDNGPWGHRYAGPFRGAKTEVFEGGIRSPLWLHWPGTLVAGQRSDQIAAHIDVTPTILDACGVPKPPHLHLDGMSLLPVLRNESTWPERTVAIQAHRGDAPMAYHNFMIRRGPWKLLHASGFQKVRFEGAPQFELYNVIDDPGEADNLMTREVAVFRTLQDAYDQWFSDVSSARPDNYAPPRIRVGSTRERETTLTRQDWRASSWSSESHGEWLLAVESAGPFVVEVLLDPVNRPGEVVLNAGGAVHAARVAANADTCTFKKVVLPRGDCALRASFHSDGKRRGAYQVKIRPLG